MKVLALIAIAITLTACAAGPKHAVQQLPADHTISLEIKPWFKVVGNDTSTYSRCMSASKGKTMSALSTQFYRQLRTTLLKNGVRLTEMGMADADLEIRVRVDASAQYGWMEVYTEKQMYNPQGDIIASTRLKRQAKLDPVRKAIKGVSRPHRDAACQHAWQQHSAAIEAHIIAQATKIANKTAADLKRNGFLNS